MTPSLSHLSPEHPANDARDTLAGPLPTVFLNEKDAGLNRKALLERSVDLCFGRTPPDPKVLKVTPLNWGSFLIEAGTASRTVSWDMQLTYPFGEGRHPVLLTGDRMWGNCNDAVKQMFLGSGFIVAEFNRTMLAEDAAPKSYSG